MDPVTPQTETILIHEPPKHFLNKKFVITFLILILLGAGTYAGIWYWQKQQLAQEVVPTFTPRVDETADWKTYTNTQYGFEVKYPKEFAIKDSLNGISNPELTLVINYMEPGCDNCGGDSKYLWISAGPKRPAISCDGVGGAINIGGTTTTRCIYSGSYFGEGEGLFIEITKGNYTYTFNSDFYDRNKTVVDEILSTFKFTDSNQLSCGGIAGKLCPSGYSCKLDGSYPDAGGVCVK